MQVLESLFFYGRSSTPSGKNMSRLQTQWRSQPPQVRPHAKPSNGMIVGLSGSFQALPHATSEA